MAKLDDELLNTIKTKNFFRKVDYIRCDAEIMLHTMTLALTNRGQILQRHEIRPDAPNAAPVLLIQREMNERGLSNGTSAVTKFDENGGLITRQSSFTNGRFNGYQNTTNFPNIFERTLRLLERKQAKTPGQPI